MEKKPGTPSFMNRFPLDVGALVARAYQLVIVVGEEALELIIALWILIMVGRVCGSHQLEGVSVFSLCVAGRD